MESLSGRGSAAGDPLTDVENALKNLMRNESDEDEISSSPSDEDQEYFCVEDTFPTTDVKIEVGNIGPLQFPLSEETVRKLIEISSKARFGRGEETVLDTDVGNTQMIPACNLKVDIDEDALNNALERIGCGLNINQSGTLEPHLYNMLIYGEGQFFKMHRDSPKEKNMVATLVIVLPSSHKGGDLIIHHNNKRHIFFGSKNPKFVKCVAFYSDCQHEIRKVTEGFRVALTYNVVLKPSSQVANGINLDECLNNAVNSYFSQNDSPKKLVFLLNHSYSENHLKWELLKGTDRNAALPLYVVAKNQNRVPCLALSKYRETCDEYNETEVYENSTKLYFFVDDQNLKMLETDIYVSDDEMCYTMETKELFEPYETEHSGPTGNAGETIENWYRRACVVIWSNKWVFSSGFNVAINELHKLTFYEGNENTIIEEIEKAGSDFYNRRFWGNSEVANKLIDIAIYLNDPRRASQIVFNFPKEVLGPNKIGQLLPLKEQVDKETWNKMMMQIVSNFPKEVLDPNNIERLLHLEKQFDGDSWDKIMKSWSSHHFCQSLTVDQNLSFVKKYWEHPGKFNDSIVVDYLLQKALSKFMNTNHRPIKYSNPYFSWYGSSSSNNTRAYSYNKIDNSVIEKIVNLLQVFSDLRKTSFQEKLVQYIVTSDVFTPVSVAELFFKLRKKFNQNQFPFFKTLKDFALAKVTNQIPELTNCSNNWYFDIKIPCRCQFCSPIQEFFHSKTQQRIVVPASKDMRRHIYSNLNPLTSYPIKFHTERTGRPYKIIIEKDSNVPKEREGILRNLLELKDKLNEVDVENEAHGIDSTSTNETPQCSSDQVEEVNNDSENGESPMKRSRLNN